LKVPAVANALARAQAVAIQKAVVTVESLVEDLREARMIALGADPPQTSGAVAATMGMAKLLGLVVDRAQLEVMHKPSPVNTKALELTEDEWKQTFDPGALERSNAKVAESGTFEGQKSYPYKAKRVST